ncbi:(Na+)-NQR maturation NqrM [Pasteurellaceae bacterium TAE3-ERU1]|uniref:(Na+)-NQR maturation NqrM n=1 Tax=Spirabiliibacterium TaxID=2820724 RepID=UPI001AAD8E91|nr:MULTISPECIES: (Na+)-NQR maturation NqrM [Spirabiliibacterium]MBE2895991.1 (Na+)-NQR maturation NqrM [Spirabiliibacterium pneumoniae]MBE2898885.1 (Na+)-NQR maturation NqrM [Spirabiliibacterium mucosae]MBV7388146.1 (Na+)-NQR maturation NqrM [Pasteurellaceae bacterium TAE3-ERU1]
MKVFLITFGVFLLVILAMSIGYIIKRRTISGSCGGISSLGLEKVCDCPEPCDKRKAKMAQEQARLDKLAQQERIL